MEHSFDVNIAKQFSIDIALFLDHIRFWTFKNLANKKHIYENLCWTYNTLEAFQDIFPYWTRRQIERVINNCIDQGLIIKGNHNQTKYDRTVWYALTYKGLALFDELLIDKYRKLLNLPISPNREMEITDRGNGDHQTVTPIPSTDPDTDRKNNLSIISPLKNSAKNGFDEFWEIYPRKTAKISCERIWKTNKLSTLFEEIIEKLRIQINQDDRFINGFIRNPLKYLREEGWNDPINKPKLSVVKSKNQPYDHESTDWAKDIEKDLF